MFYKVELCFLQAKGVLALTLATCSLTSSTPGKSIDCSYEWADVTSYHIHHILHILGKSQVQKKREARDARLTVMVGAMVGPHHHFLSFVDTIRLWPFQSIWADKLAYDTYFIRMIGCDNYCFNRSALSWSFGLLMQSFQSARLQVLASLQFCRIKYSSY